MIHCAVNLFLSGKFVGFFKDFFEFHNKSAAAGQSILTCHLFEHFIDNHECSFRPKARGEFKCFFSHKACYRRLSNLLGNNDNVPIVELMRDVLDGIFIWLLMFYQLSHILIKLDVNFSQSIHYDKRKIT